MKISVQGNLQTKPLVGSYAEVEKRIIADLDKLQVKDGKKPLSKISEEVVIEPYRDGSYPYHAMLSEAAKIFDLSPEIQKYATMSTD